MFCKTQKKTPLSANKVKEWGFSPAIMEKEKAGKFHPAEAKSLKVHDHFCLNCWLPRKHRLHIRVRSSRAGSHCRPELAVRKGGWLILSLAGALMHRNIRLEKKVYTSLEKRGLRKDLISPCNYLKVDCIQVGVSLF